jgi:large subunit ribosomal protein L15
MQVVNVATLDILIGKGKIANGVVTPEVLFKLGATTKKNIPVKILSKGELKSKLDITAHAFSKSAVSKIEAAGGKATIITKTTPKS